MYLKDIFIKLRAFPVRSSSVEFRLHFCLNFTVCICIFMRDFSGSVWVPGTGCGSESESESGSDSVPAASSPFSVSVGAWSFWPGSVQFFFLPGCLSKLPAPSTIDRWELGSWEVGLLGGNGCWNEWKCGWPCCRTRELICQNSSAADRIR